MLTLALQCLNSVLSLLFGAMALSVSRYPIAPDRRAGWRLAGMAFLLLGMESAVQDAGAVAAYLSGAGTPVYDAYLRWAPALNHSRVAAGIAFAGMLAWAAWTGRFPPRRVWTALAAGLAGAMLAGAGLGALEGGFDPGTHGLTTAIGVTLELIAFAAALLVAATRGTLDVFLFTALTFYAANMALVVPLLSAATGLPVLGPRPPPWVIQFQPVVLQTLMVGLAGVRLGLLRRGLRVREVFGREPASRLRLVELDPADAAPRIRPPRRKA